MFSKFFTPFLIICMLAGSASIVAQPAQKYKVNFHPSGPFNHLDVPEYTIWFFERYLMEAVRASRALGVPVSIILGVAALESGYGLARTRVVRECNNLYNIKTWQVSDPGCCKEVIEYNTDEKRACFRKYRRPEDSLWDFCRLMQKDRYKHLLRLQKKDYRNWAEGLPRAGYATDPRYTYKLISVIERYELYRFDY